MSVDVATLLPAGKTLAAWIEADQPVLTELKASVAAISKVNELVRALPGRFGGQQTAPQTG